MPELRKDPVVGRWVIIATERAKRPSDFCKNDKDSVQLYIPETECPFCENNEQHTKPEIFVYERLDNTKPNSPGWQVRVVPSISPILKIEGELDRHGEGMYDLMRGVGAHEVVIETPKHISSMVHLDESHISKVIWTWLQRIEDLEKDVRFKYVLLFKNHGMEAGGGTIKHTRSQLMALPVTPKRVKEELLGSKKYFEYKERCIFCDIIRQELNQYQRIVAETEHFLAFEPYPGRFPFETWVLPKVHSADFYNISDDVVPDLAKALKVTLTKLYNGVGDPPFNVLLHTAPFRRKKEGYWKTIDEDYHWHFEILPRLTKMAGFEWGTGFYINPMLPEQAAEFLKGVEV